MNLDRVNELYLGKIFSPETQRACRERIHWICSEIAGKKVLDIGCSQGIVCLILGREGFECVGIDIEEASINYARSELEKEGKLVKEKVRFEIGDATHLPFGDDSFDTVILGEIIEHLTNPKVVLAEARRVLKGGGRVIITTPFGLNPHHDHKQTFYPLSFLNLVQSLFRTDKVDTADNYFRYCGKNDPSYDPAKIPVADLFKDYKYLLGRVEERCEGKELELFEKSTKLYDQIKLLTDQVGSLKTSLGSKDLELSRFHKQQEAIEKKEKELFDFLNRGDETLQTMLIKQRADFSDMLSKKQNEFQNLIKQKDIELKEMLDKQRKDHNDAIAQKDVRLRETLDRQREEHQKALKVKDDQLKETLDRQREDHQKALRVKDDQLKETLDGQRKDHFESLQLKDKERRESLDKQLRDHEKSLADKELEFQRQLRSKEKYFEDKITNLQKDHQNKLSKNELEARENLLRRETEIKSNRRWRVGQFIVNPLELLADLIKDPAATFSRVTKSLSKREMPQSLGSLSLKSPKMRDHKPVPEQPSVYVREPARTAVPEKRIPVAAVLDEFSTACFAPECDLITFRPDNWKETIEESKPEMLLVESAWRGNDGSWQYKVASYQKAMGEELAELVSYCKSRKIPTVFWNKEDPSNYDRFIHRAPIFDYVFTTDAECIPKYRERVGHNRVFALPFAAQPAIHNPVTAKPREHNVAFAGAYYNVSFDQRKLDMDMVLKPALDFGLHIYDRQHGVTGPLAEQFRFPEIYQPAIKGRLEYDDMVKAYKQYKVFLNVNSVTTSPTMFSRRVFELLASGTPVVSAYARGIEEMLGPDTVLIARSEEDTRRHLEKILGNNEEWLRLSVRGIREVLSAHSYGHRFNELLGKVGITSSGSRLPKITVLVRPESASDLRIIGFTLNQQTYRNMQVLLFSGKTISKSDVESFKSGLADIPVTTLQTSDVIGALAKHADGEYFWLVSWKDFYAPAFLMDAVLATTYSTADIIGKHTHYELGPNGSTIEFKGGGHEFMPVQSVVPGSALIRVNKLSKEELSGFLANRTITFAKERGVSIDRFNFLRNAFSSDRATPANIDTIASKVVV